jgi:uncharacterized delta-60 repeat protein
VQNSRHHCRRIPLAIALIAALLTLTAGPAGADAGDRDPSFGIDGAVVQAGADGTFITDVAVQSDGSVVFASFTNDVATGNSEGRVVRLNEAGNLDPTFGTGGVTTIGPFTGEFLTFFKMALAPDDSLIVTTYPQSPFRESRLASGVEVLRFSSDGVLDPTFTAPVSLPPISDVAVMSNGRIVLHAVDSLIALTSTGAVDTAFGTAGGLGVDPGTTIEQLELLSDDRIIVTTEVLTARGDTLLDPPTVKRFSATGVPDVTFGGDGTIELTRATPNTISTFVVGATAGGDLLSVEEFDDQLALSKYTATGTLDSTFGTAGMTTVQFGPSLSSGIVEVLFDDAGAAYLAGVVESGEDGADQVAAVTRLTPSGEIDTSYGTDGVTTLELGGTDRQGRVTISQTYLDAAVFDQDGRLVVGVSNTSVGVGIFRLLDDSEPEPTPVRRCQGQVVTVDLSLGQVPTAGPDVILGTPGDDVIRGLGGDDLICARGGNDNVRGGAGNDVIFGGPGNDIIGGGIGDDALNGRAGNDTLFGRAGDDTLNGGRGDDTCNGGQGTNTLSSC